MNQNAKRDSFIPILLFQYIPIIETHKNGKTLETPSKQIIQSYHVQKKNFKEQWGT